MCFSKYFGAFKNNELQVEGFEFERSPTSPEVHSLIEDADEADEDKWKRQRVIGVHVRISLIQLHLLLLFS